MEDLKFHKETLIFYEAPHHLKSTLKNLLKTLGNREAVLARELTKIHEEFIRSKLEDLILQFEETELRGEFVIVVDGADDEIIDSSDESTIDIMTVYQKFIADGLDKKTAMRETAKRLNISRREVYNYILTKES